MKNLEKLIALHKAIIDTERSNLERLEGRLTGGEMLQRLVSDERFAWLRALTAVIARLDEITDADTDEGLADCLGQARQLLTPATTPFWQEYERLLQESPDVVLAHASAVGALRAAA